MDLEQHVSEIQDWPRPGVSFKDITIVMNNDEAYGYTTDRIMGYTKDGDADIVTEPEARGFIIGCPVAYSMGIDSVPVRKEGRLLREVIRCGYDLGYDTDILTVHRDAIEPGQRVLITGDLLATSDTTEAVMRLVEKLGGVVISIAFVIELKYLNGTEEIKDYGVISLISYDE